MNNKLRKLPVMSCPALMLCALITPIAVSAEEVTDLFVATATVVDSTPTCTFQAGSADFGTLTKEEELLDARSTNFAVNFNCSSAVEFATLTFAKENTNDPNGWSLKATENGDGFGVITYKIFDAVGNSVLPDAGYELPLGAGNQNLTFTAEITKSTLNDLFLVGEYQSTVDVTFSF